MCAEVKSGNLRTSVSVQFSTANGVAIGIYMGNFYSRYNNNYYSLT